jgi:hypothetical protein
MEKYLLERKLFVGFTEKKHSTGKSFILPDFKYFAYCKVPNKISTIYRLSSLLSLALFSNFCRDCCYFDLALLQSRDK